MNDHSQLGSENPSRMARDVSRAQQLANIRVLAERELVDESVHRLAELIARWGDYEEHWMTSGDLDELRNVKRLLHQLSVLLASRAENATGLSG